MESGAPDSLPRNAISRFANRRRSTLLLLLTAQCPQGESSRQSRTASVQGRLQARIWTGLGTASRLAATNSVVSSLSRSTRRIFGYRPDWPRSRRCRIPPDKRRPGKPPERAVDIPPLWQEAQSQSGCGVELRRYEINEISGRGRSAKRRQKTTFRSVFRNRL